MIRSESTRRASAGGQPRTAAGRAKGKPARTAVSSPRPRPRAAAASKISITVDSAVLQEIKRLIHGTGLSLSAHITQALERDLRRRRLQQILDEYEDEHGTITEEELAHARAAWEA